MYDTDVMDDLFYESAEGPAVMGYGDEFDDDFDDYDDFDDDDDDFDDDDFDDYDDFDDDDDFDAYDDYDDYDDFDAYDAYDALDALDEVVAQALGADDADEFFKKLVSGAKTVARAAKKAAPLLGKAARTVAPIASSIPLPQAQAIGRVAGLLGKLMFDGADEFEALDALADYADYMDDIDAASSMIAGLSIQRAMPGAKRLPKSKRLQLVKSVRKSTQQLGKRQGPKVTKAMPVLVKHAAKTTQKTGTPLTKSIAKTTAMASKRPAAAKQIAKNVSKVAKMKSGKVSKMGGKKRRYRLRGPVSITIHER